MTGTPDANAFAVLSQSIAMHGLAFRDAAAQIAGLLCASTDLDGLPYALAPAPGCAGIAEAFACLQRAAG